MQTLQLKEGLYWNGILDPDLRVFDIIMETEFGTTYNSYLIKGAEKNALVETAKGNFSGEYLQALEHLIDWSDMDYLIVNHTEPDHAGSVGALLERNPNLVVVGTVTAIRFLTEIVNKPFQSRTVKDGDTLSLGGKTLRFFVLPNLHWPDTMYTYLEEDGVLFSCDSFGAHYSHPGILRSAITAEEDYKKAVRYYFDCILGPYKRPYLVNALQRIQPLRIEMICPGHGPVLDSHIEDILGWYQEWCREPKGEPSVVIPYVSAYGYTRQLAESIEKGVRDSGIRTMRYDLVETGLEPVMEAMQTADGLLFGTPTILGEALKPIWDLTAAMTPVGYSGRYAGAFGSYGWSGEGVPHILERLRQLKCHVADGFRVRFRPTEKDLMEAYEYGYQFGCTVQNKENDRSAKKTGGQVRCLVCGAVFDADAKCCPVCGVGPEQFVPLEKEQSGRRKDTEELFLVLGGGVAAVRAVEAIRERNATASIVLVSQESFLPYHRPMLTKVALSSQASSDELEKELAIHDLNWYEQNGVILLLDKQVSRISAEDREVVLSDGVKLRYDKCVYALGASCFVPPVPGKEKAGTGVIRSLEDVMKLRNCLNGPRQVVVIGGGVLGLEAAWEFRRMGCSVTVLEGSERIMSRQLDSSVSRRLEKAVRDQGITVYTGVSAKQIVGEETVSGVELTDGRILPADFVLFSCGVRANTSVAQTAALDIGRAIRVNRKMETGLNGIFACGDCAECEGMNYAVWPEASDMGYVAGANAAGDALEYEPISPAVTFQGMGTALFAAGDAGTDWKMIYQTVEFDDPAQKSFEKYYFRDGRLVGGVLLGDLSSIAKLTDALRQNQTRGEFLAAIH